MTAVLLLHEHVTPVGIAGVIVTTCGAIMYSVAKRTLQGGTNTDPKDWKFIAAMAMAVVALTCFAGVGGDLEKKHYGIENKLWPQRSSSMQSAICLWFQFKLFPHATEKSSI